AEVLPAARIGKVVIDSHDPTAPLLLAAVSGLCGVGVAVTRGRTVLGVFRFEGSSDRLVKLRLIVFDGEQVVAAPIDDRARELELATCSVNGHEAALEVQQSEKARNRFDFVRILCSCDLAEDDCVCSTPRADHADEAPTASSVKRTPQDLAIDRDDVLFRGL